MNYPKLRVPKVSRQTVDVFKGYNHNLRIGDGEFYEMQNMTSDYYPVLSPRSGRGNYLTVNANGLINKDALCYVSGRNFVINEKSIDMGLTDDPKQLISMGAYVIIMPDRKWVNTADESWGYIDAEYVKADGEKATFNLCRVDGSSYIDENTDLNDSATEPQNPKDQELWLDISSTPNTLKQWSESAGMWVTIATTYVRISAANIDQYFEVNDGIQISGLEGTEVESLNGAAVVWGKGEGYIVVVGILDGKATVTQAITITRKMPKMDFVIESGNRLWGCRYGMAANGQVVNEIYASKLGDFKNWNCYMSISTDSYTASVGTDGQFTGAITHMGYPLFFKENYLHKVYGTQPSNFQIQTTACTGVQKDSGRSLAIVGSTLLYKGRNGVCAYDGSLPSEVSYALGNESYTHAVAGANGYKYYISMTDDAGDQHLFVYDLQKAMWHREDDLRVNFFCSCDGLMYAATDDKILTLNSGNDPVEWMVQTGDVGITTPDMKYVSRLNLRMSMAEGAEVKAYAQYDFSEEWEELFTITGKSLRSFSLPIRPKRCDNMRLRLEGNGAVKIYSLTKTIEQGSDLS